jgi:ubiquilin
MPDFGGMMGGTPFGMPPMGGNSGGGGQGLDFSSLLQQFQSTGLSAAAAGGGGFGSAGGGGGAGGFGSAPAPSAIPADRYRNQLQQLYGMGFDDEQANLTALQAAHGNLNRAVDQLLSAPPPVTSPAPAPAASNTDTGAGGTSNSSPGDEDRDPKDAVEKKND